MKYVLDESMFEDAFLRQDQQALDNAAANLQDPVPVVNQVAAARQRTLNSRREELRKYFEQQDKEVEEFLKVNMDRTPRTLSKDAIHRDAYKKAMLAESLFEDADPVEDNVEEMPDEISKEELINDTMTSAEKLANLIDEYRSDERGISEKGQKFIDKVFDAIYNLLNLIGDEEDEDNDMAEALNKFRYKRIKESLNLTEAIHWARTLKQIISSITNNGKVYIVTDDGEVLTNDPIPASEVNIPGSDNCTVLEITEGPEPNSIQIVIDSEQLNYHRDDEASIEPETISNEDLNEGAKKKFLDDGSLNPDWNRIKSDTVYYLHVLDSDFEEMFAKKTVYPGPCIKTIDKLHTELDSPKYQNAYLIEVGRYPSNAEFLKDPNHYLNNAVKVYEEEKQEDGSWKVINNNLRKGDHLTVGPEEDDDEYDRIPEEYIPNRRNRLYADLISSAGTDQFAVAYRNLTLIPRNWNNARIRVLLSSGRYGGDAEITKSYLNPDIIQIETTQEKRVKFAQKVCACYNCSFTVDSEARRNKNSGEYIQDKKHPFRISIRVLDASEIIDKVDKPENIPAVLSYVDELLQEKNNMVNNSEEQSVNNPDTAVNSEANSTEEV